MANNTVRMRKTVLPCLLITLFVGLSAFRDGSKMVINKQNLSAPTMAPKKPSFVFNKVEPLHPFLVEVLLPAKGGLVRGIDFGMSREDVRKRENACEEENGDYRSRYSVACSIPEMAATADVVYDFHTDGFMDMVTIDYYLADPYVTKAIYHDLLQYYNKQYGKQSYTDADGYVVWETARYTADGSRQPMALYLKNVGRGDDSGIVIQFVRK